MKNIFFFLLGERDFRKQKKQKFGPVFNFKKGQNIGPVFNLTACIYIYIFIYLHTYIYVVKLLFCPNLAFSGVIIWSRLGSLSDPSLFFLTYFYSGFKRFLKQSVIILCVLCAHLSCNFLKHPFPKKWCKNWVIRFSVLSFKF